MLNIRLHAHGWHRFVAVIFFPIMLVRRAVPFLIGGRADAIAAMFRGIADSLRAGTATSFKNLSDDKLKNVPDEAAE